jgi:hypothetical protein
MNWLESHVWLATWLALPVGIVTIFAQNVTTKFEQFDPQPKLVAFDGADPGQFHAPRRLVRSLHRS